MGVIHLGPLSALPGTCIVLRALAMLYDPGGTCTVLAYRPVHFCLRPKLGYRLPLVVLSRLNRFTLSHYGSRTPLSTLHAGLTASHARLSTGCLLGFAGSGLSPDYTIHAELAHNLRTLGAIAPSNLRTLTPNRACPYPISQQYPFFIQYFILILIKSHPYAENCDACRLSSIFLRFPLISLLTYPAFRPYNTSKKQGGFS